MRNPNLAFNVLLMITLTGLAYMLYQSRQTNESVEVFKEQTAETLTEFKEETEDSVTELKEQAKLELPASINDVLREELFDGETVIKALKDSESAKKIAISAQNNTDKLADYRFKSIDMTLHLQTQKVSRRSFGNYYLCHDIRVDEIAAYYKKHNTEITDFGNYLMTENDLCEVGK